MKEVNGRDITGMSFADLHMHTTGSLDVRRRANGLSPHEAVLSAEKAGLSALAITDHDNIESSLEALFFAQKENLRVEIIPGVEITTKDGHLIGLYLNDPTERGTGMVDAIRQIHKQGGLAIVPHPFFRILRSAKRRIISDIIRSNDPEIYFDGFEIHNTGVEDSASRKKGIRDTNNFAQRLYANHAVQLGAPIGSSDGHRMTVGRGLTAYKGNLKTAIKNRETMAVTMGPEDNRRLILNAIELFGEKRVLGGTTFQEFEEKYKTRD